MTTRPESLIGDTLLETLRILAAGAPPGAFVEIGVYKGGSAAVLYEIAQQQQRRLYLYDTFAGMPVAQPGLDSHRIGDFADCDAETVKRLFPRATVVQGIFPQSCRLTHRSRIAFVHADADQYESTAAVCRVFPPLMVPGGMILFDDYRGLAGCIKAVDEHFPGREVLPDNRALVRF